MCQECYADDSRITPLLNQEECLENHTQYIWETCGRCICIQKDAVRGLQRWNFPFKSLDIAKLYLRAADYTVKTCTDRMDFTALTDDTGGKNVGNTCGRRK